MMTSNTSSSSFKLTLLKVSEVLTEKNVQDLTFLCDDISPARRELITNARELFDALQGHELLNDQNVDVLIEWLDELRLAKASNLLKEYRAAHFKGIAGNDKNKENCYIHEDLPMKYFCVSCEAKICPDCAFTNHNLNCDVIKVEEVSSVAKDRCATLEEKLQLLESSINEVSQTYQERDMFSSRIRQLSRNEVHDDFSALIRQVETMWHMQLEKIHQSEIRDMKQLLEKKKTTENFQKQVQTMQSCYKISKANPLSNLLEITRSLKKVESIQVELERQKEKLQAGTVDLDHRMLPQDEGGFSIITISVLKGSVILRENQLLNIFDERKCNDGIHLLCVDPFDTMKEYWRHLVKLNGNQYPVVTSKKELYSDGKDHALFAVGKTVYVICPLRSGSLYNSVGTVTPIEIKEVPKGFWITSISTHCTDENTNDAFLISTSVDQSIREYSVSGSALRVIDTSDILDSTVTSSVAYGKNVLAIITRGRDDIPLVDTSGEKPKHFLSIKLPSSVANMKPLDVVWTGSHWLVLHISDAPERDWKVVLHKDTGEIVEWCTEGKSSSANDIPVCITRSVQAGYVVLADTSVGSFNLENPSISETPLT